MEYLTTGWEERHAASLRRGPRKTENSEATDVQNRDAWRGKARRHPQSKAPSPNKVLSLVSPSLLIRRKRWRTTYFKITQGKKHKTRQKDWG